MDKIIKVIPLDNHKLHILTSSGITGIFDIKPYLQGTAFQELMDTNYFKQVRPAHRGIIWPHGQDLSSDTIIYDIKSAS